MIYPMYAYRDNKSNFSMPYAEMNDASALRGFAYLCSGKDSIMSFSPADYDLFKVGTFDTDSGLMEASATLVFLANGSSVVGEKYEK